MALCRLTTSSACCIHASFLDSKCMACSGHIGCTPSPVEGITREPHVCGVQAARAHILACECDLAEMHRLLNNLPILRWATADQLAQEAVAAYKAASPEVLLRQYNLRMLRCAMIVDLVG